MCGNYDENALKMETKNSPREQDTIILVYEGICFLGREVFINLK